MGLVADSLDMLADSLCIYWLYLQLEKPLKRKKNVAKIMNVSVDFAILGLIRSFAKIFFCKKQKLQEFQMMMLISF